MTQKRIATILIIMAVVAHSALAIVVKDYNWRTDTLDRGLVVIPTNTGNFVSWRYLPTDGKEAQFDILRNGEVIARNLKSATSYADNKSGSSLKYQIVTKIDGVAVDTTPEVAPWKTKYYMELKLDVPPSGSFHGTGYTFSAGDCSVGDVDGDGQYEIFVKWDPSSQKDSSQDGYTGPCIIDCYKLDGTKLWRINLGPNVRTGAHYTQFMVYDFDGDGRAEMICKTAPGSIDGKGKYVSEVADLAEIKNTDNTKDYVLSNGREGGPEYLTAFDGLTGEAVHTIFYNPNRAGSVGGAPGFPDSDYWGKKGDRGNRASRFLACVAFLAGHDKNPSAVMIRGYYARCFAWAVDFTDKKLKTRWLHHSSHWTKYTVTTASGNTVEYGGVIGTGNNGTSTAYSNGNHNLSVGDVDFDGKDEIIIGATCFDHNGRVLYTTGLGHGDAMHLGDLDPDRPGLEVFTVQESGQFGFTYYAAENGKVLIRSTGSKDTGRGIAADVYPDKRGYEMWAANIDAVYNVDGTEVGKRGSQNFRVYWDGDLYDELLDGGTITKYGVGELKINGKSGYNYGSSCNGSKNTPNISADIFGDWREEIILHNNTSLIILSSTEPTDYRVPCLMTDHTYRMAIAWQNCCYNQPPHLGYYLPDKVDPPKIGFTFYDESLRRQTVTLGDSIKPVKIHYDGCTDISTYRTILPDGTRKIILLPEGWTLTKDPENADATLTGKPEMTGTYTFVIRSVGQSTPEQFYDTLYVDVIEAASAIDNIYQNATYSRNRRNIVTDILGRKVAESAGGKFLRPGLYVVEGKKIIIK